jgi:hypothetical protein
LFSTRAEPAGSEVVWREFTVEVELGVIDGAFLIEASDIVEQVVVVIREHFEVLIVLDDWVAVIVSKVRHFLHTPFLSRRLLAHPTQTLGWVKRRFKPSTEGNANDEFLHSER